jgi:hypothetical protein
MLNNYYTYELCSSETPTIPFYIGYGQGNRMYSHEKKAIKYPNKNLYVLDKIRSILKEENTLVYRKIIENVSKEEAIRNEIGRIVVLKIMGFKLCNLTNGGDDGDTFTNNPHKEQIRNKCKENSERKGIHPWNFGKKLPSLTKEHKDKLRIANTGKKHSEQRKQNMRKPHRSAGPRPQKVKDKISASLMNHIVTKETKNKISLSLLGKKI